MSWETIMATASFLAIVASWAVIPVVSASKVTHLKRVERPVSDEVVAVNDLREAA